MNGYVEGEVCGRNGCQGIIDMHPSENCSCHINPPCSSCTDPRNFCPLCGWEEKYANFDSNGEEVDEEKTLQPPPSIIGYKPL